MANIIETEEHLQLIGSLLNEQFEPMGFALIVFPFENPGISNYISNGNREDMVKALRETADRIENNQTIGPVQGGIN